MRSLLLDYEEERVSLGDLINTLEALLSVLEDTPETWKERFKSEWWTLEQVYAVNLDRNQGALKLTQQEQGLIAETLASLRKLLAELRRGA